MNLLKKIFNRNHLWHIIAVAIFLIISCTYFYPGLFGYSVVQSDVTHWSGAAQEIIDYRESGNQIGWTSSMFSGMPSTQISVIYEGRSIIDFFRTILTFGLPQPISLLFLYFIGFYILAISFKSSPIVAIIGSLAYGLSSYFIIIIQVGHITKAVAIGYAPLLIAGFILAYRRNNWLLGVGLSSLFMALQLSANHLQITYYVLFILLGLGIVELVRFAKMKGGILQFWKISLSLLFAYAVAIAINYGNIAGTAEYTENTTRGGSELTIKPDGTQITENRTSGLNREYITAWSYGKLETFTFIVPNFKGGATGRIDSDENNKDVLKNVNSQFKQNIKGWNQYWGEQLTSGPVYLGAFVVLLSLLGLVHSNEKSRWMLLSVTVITVFLSWGKNWMWFTDIFIDYVPGYDKFRAVTIILVVAEICVPVLCVFFLNKLYESKNDIIKNVKFFYYVVGAYLFVLLLMFIFPSLMNTFISDGEAEMLASADPTMVVIYEDFFSELEKVRVSIFRKDVLRSLLFAGFGAGILLVYLRTSISKNIVFSVIAVLIFSDLFLVDTRYLNTEKSGRNFDQWVETYKQKYPYISGNGEKKILEREINQKPELFKKLDSTRTEVERTIDYSDMSAGEKMRVHDWVQFRSLNRLTNYRVMDVEQPFMSTYTSYFHKSIGGYHGAKLGKYQELIEFHLAKNNPSVIDMLNVKYKIRPLRNSSGAMDGSELIAVNLTAMGNAWMTKSVKFVPNADQEIVALNSENTFKVETFGDFKIIVNGLVDSTGIINRSDQIELIYFASRDSAGNELTDTIPVAIPLDAANPYTQLAYVFTVHGLKWEYITDVDSTEIPVLGVTQFGRSGWRPEEETIIDERFKKLISKVEYSGRGLIELKSYHPDRLVYSFSSDEPQLVVFSEIYYPVGWKAFIDDQEKEIARVNYVLRAVEVPAGNHKIEFVYELSSYKRAKYIAWTGSAVLLLLLGLGLAQSFKNRRSRFIE